MPLTPEQLTIIGMMLAIGALGLKKVWVFGWTFEAKQTDLEAMTTDRNFWRDIAVKMMTHTEKTTDLLVAESSAKDK